MSVSFKTLEEFLLQNCKLDEKTVSSFIGEAKKTQIDISSLSQIKTQSKILSAFGSEKQKELSAGLSKFYQSKHKLININENNIIDNNNNNNDKNDDNKNELKNDEININDNDIESKYDFLKELANTLQGRIYLGKYKNNKNYTVIKEAWKYLVDSCKARSGYPVPENFKDELILMKCLSKDPTLPKGIVKALDFYEDGKCYYLVMEYCNEALFNYIKNRFKNLESFIKSESQKPQELCENNKANSWMIKVQLLFTQLVYNVKYLHSKNICHRDLSLENTMLQKMKIEKNDKNLPELNDDLNIIKIIDFGLGMDYTTVKNDENRFKGKTRVGKLGYMSPECYARQLYDARSNDIFCLGIMLFMMLIGAPPYDKPDTTKDRVFKYIINGRLGDVLKHWKRIRFVTKDALDVMNKCITYEKDRISLDNLIKHPYIVNGTKIGQELLPELYPKIKKRRNRGNRSSKKLN